MNKKISYEVSIGWLNRYWPAQGQSEPKLLHTGFGFPSTPKEPNAMALSPDTVLLSWSMPDLLNAPANEIRYRVGIRYSRGAEFRNYFKKKNINN